jgi:diamine N-acetyltransferase
MLLRPLPLCSPPPYLNLRLMPLLSALVRSAILSDAPALAALGRTTFVQTFMEDFAIPYPPNDIAAYLNKNYTEDAVCAMLQESGAMTWVAEKDGVMLAFANAGPNTLPSVFCTMKRSSAC